MDIKLNQVTSYTEVWIEIKAMAQAARIMSVTSYTEVWIEIFQNWILIMCPACHFLHGSVD